MAKADKVLDAKIPKWAAKSLRQMPYGEFKHLKTSSARASWGQVAKPTVPSGSRLSVEVSDLKDGRIGLDVSLRARGAKRACELDTLYGLSSGQPTIVGCESLLFVVTAQRL